MSLAIRVENLGKRYRLGQTHAGSIRELVNRMVDRLTGPKAPLFPEEANGWEAHALSAEKAREFWALRDVSLEVRAGEVVGVIGRNGAGKSTLLKILSGITSPTMGRVELHGRVASLLEVGTGFHPELSGRENIYLNGAILGMTKAEVRRKFDEIVAFAEVDRFIDTPVKRYSSGMYVRLAFAVAAHLDPEILLIDEVLAVGDAGFQKKCLGRMGRVAREGRTVIFVSHNMAAVEHLCGRVALLDRGGVRFVGSTTDGLREYIKIGVDAVHGELDLRSHPNRRPGSVPLLKKVTLYDHFGAATTTMTAGQSMRIEFQVEPHACLSQPQFGIGVDDYLGTRLFSLATFLSASCLPSLDRACTIVCKVDRLPLLTGRYTLSLSAGTWDKLLIDAIDHAIAFDVEPGDYFGNGRLPSGSLGSLLVGSQWERTE